MNNQTCIFCDIVEPANHNSISYLEIFDNDYCKVILDIKPISRGHLIIIAKQHHAKLHGLSKSIYDEIFRVANLLTNQLPLCLSGVTATNLVVNDGKDSGQHIAHAHIHIIPRKKHDSLYFYWRLLTRFINPFSRLNRWENLNSTHQLLVNSEIVLKDG